ncbi:glutamate racemase [Tunturiibacter gelidoferens]|uniref:Glutamate racemase n=1 Tax=Tunturiibacter gelidiferens TaxID=3069689 RepID=A0ACC5NU51_9BACT|nr:glutamate racemase [Edaphobacter lichenicola]MBB5338000.1 glutamate racemase [Edaphobacter lichenicola]
MTESPAANPNTAKSLTIGVFDSGFGGLTVLRALLPLIPHAHYLFLGDTARLPYGSKSRETVARYAVSSAKFLHAQGADLLVIACNTATALALPDIQQALPIPVIGVVEPGAQAALATSSFPDSPNHVLVLATQATVQSHAYTHALNALGLEACEKACPLLVPLVEEGWTNHPVTDEVLKIYLTEALAAAPATQTLLLGCTHYPLIEPAIHRTLDSIGHTLTIIDSAEATARATATLVAQHFPNLTPTAKPTCTFYATDSIEKFQRLGSNFLGQPVTEVNLVDLGG